MTASSPPTKSRSSGSGPRWSPPAADTASRSGRRACATGSPRCSTTLAADPALASISLVEGLRAGRGVYDRYQAAVESFVVYLREGAPEAPGGGEVPEATDEAVVGGIASMLGRRVLAGEAEQIDELLPEVLEFALTPYLGTAEARRIISAG